MAITDSTTTLDTAWAEQSHAQVLGKTLSAEADLVSAVEAKLKRGTLGATTSPTAANVKIWLSRAKGEIASIKGFTFVRRFMSHTLTIGNFIVSLPNDFDGGSVRIRDITNRHEWVYLPNHIFDARYPDLSAITGGQVHVYTIKNLELWFTPTSTAAVLEIEYNRSGDDNITSDFSWLPERERWRCVDYALSEAFESLENFQNAQYYRAKYEAGLQGSIKADARRKWKEMGYAAISIVQAGRMRY